MKQHTFSVILLLECAYPKLLIFDQTIVLIIGISEHSSREMNYIFVFYLDSMAGENVKLKIQFTSQLFSLKMFTILHNIFGYYG